MVQHNTTEKFKLSLLNNKDTRYLLSLATIASLVQTLDAEAKTKYLASHCDMGTSVGWTPGIGLQGKTQELFNDDLYKEVEQLLQEYFFENTLESLLDKKTTRNARLMKVFHRLGSSLQEYNTTALQSRGFLGKDLPATPKLQVMKNEYSKSHLYLAEQLEYLLQEVRKDIVAYMSNESYNPEKVITLTTVLATSGVKRGVSLSATTKLATIVWNKIKKNDLVYASVLDQQLADVIERTTAELETAREQVAVRSVTTNSLADVVKIRDLEDKIRFLQSLQQGVKATSEMYDEQILLNILAKVDETIDGKSFRERQMETMMIDDGPRLELAGKLVPALNLNNQHLSQETKDQIVAVILEAHYFELDEQDQDKGDIVTETATQVSSITRLKAKLKILSVLLQNGELQATGLTQEGLVTLLRAAICGRKDDVSQIFTGIHIENTNKKEMMQDLKNHARNLLVVDLTKHKGNDLMTMTTEEVAIFKKVFEEKLLECINKLTLHSYGIKKFKELDIINALDNSSESMEIKDEILALFAEEVLGDEYQTLIDILYADIKEKIRREEEKENEQKQSSKGESNDEQGDIGKDQSNFFNDEGKKKECQQEPNISCNIEELIKRLNERYTIEYRPSPQGAYGVKKYGDQNAYCVIGIKEGVNINIEEMYKDYTTVSQYMKRYICGGSKGKYSSNHIIGRDEFIGPHVDLFGRFLNEVYGCPAFDKATQMHLIQIYQDELKKINEEEPGLSGRGKLALDMLVKSSIKGLIYIVNFNIGQQIHQQNIDRSEIVSELSERLIVYLGTCDTKKDASILAYFNGFIVKHIGSKYLHSTIEDKPIDADDLTLSIEHIDHTVQYEQSLGFEEDEMHYIYPKGWDEDSQSKYHYRHRIARGRAQESSLPLFPGVKNAIIQKQYQLQREDILSDYNDFTSTKDIKDYIEELKAYSLGIHDNGVSLLSPRSREILDMYFGLNGKDPMTLDDIGQIHGLTREGVRQIREKACRVLRKVVNNMGNKYKEDINHAFGHDAKLYHFYLKIEKTHHLIMALKYKLRDFQDNNIIMSFVNDLIKKNIDIKSHEIFEGYSKSTTSFLNSLSVLMEAKMLINQYNENLAPFYYHNFYAFKQNKGNWFAYGEHSNEFLKEMNAMINALKHKLDIATLDQYITKIINSDLYVLHGSRMYEVLYKAMVKKLQSRLIIPKDLPETMLGIVKKELTDMYIKNLTELNNVFSYTLHSSSLLTPHIPSIQLAQEIPENNHTKNTIVMDDKYAEKIEQLQALGFSDIDIFARILVGDEYEKKYYYIIAPHRLEKRLDAGFNHYDVSMIILSLSEKELMKIFGEIEILQYFYTLGMLPSVMRKVIISDGGYEKIQLLKNNQNRITEDVLQYINEYQYFHITELKRLLGSFSLIEKHEEVIKDYNDSNIPIEKIEENAISQKIDGKEVVEYNSKHYLIIKRNSTIINRYGNSAHIIKYLESWTKKKGYLIESFGEYNISSGKNSVQMIEFEKWKEFVEEGLPEINILRFAERNNSKKKIMIDNSNIIFTHNDKEYMVIIQDHQLFQKYEGQSLLLAEFVGWMYENDYQVFQDDEYIFLNKRSMTNVVVEFEKWLDFVQEKGLDKKLNDRYEKYYKESTWYNYSYDLIKLEERNK